MKRNWAWQILIGLTGVLWGTALVAAKIITLLPPLECETVDQRSPLGARLSCAQDRADQQTPSGLATAIERVGGISPDEPLEPIGQNLVKSWNEQLLALAEAEFQAGNLREAIRIARLITERSSIYAQARDRISDWKMADEKAAMITQQALRQMENELWGQAFQTAHQLQQIKSDYWAKQKHAALVQQIQADREDRDWQLKAPTEPKLQHRMPPVLPSEIAMPRFAKAKTPQDIAQRPTLERMALPSFKRIGDATKSVGLQRVEIKRKQSQPAFGEASLDLEPQLVPVDDLETLQKQELSAVQPKKGEIQDKPSELQMP